MTVDEHVMNRYSISNYVPGQFHKLFDTTSPYFHSASDVLQQTKRHQFQFNPFPMGILNPGLEMSKLERGFNNSHAWKSGMPYFPLQHQYSSLKYFAPPPPGSMEMLNNYLQGPSPDMIKYVEKIREEEIATKMKDSPEAKLCEDDLWKRFNGLTTEMVITKSGRRMFPAFKVQLSGLDQKSKYVLALEMMPCDDNRFKFHNGKWTLAGKADPESNRLLYFHCESPATGESWMQKAVWFNKVKLTNNPTDKDPQHLVLNSMHKYVIRLYIFRVDDTNKVRFCLYPEMFVFRTTEFIAVTAYQNDKITQLKIDNNPFAKGFRDNGSGRREKKRLKYQQTITSTSPDSPTELDEDAEVKVDSVTKIGGECDLLVAKEASPCSPGSSCSSQGHQEENPHDLKRKFVEESAEHAPPTKKRGVTINRATSAKYPTEEMSNGLRGPHTVHYTPCRVVPPSMGFMDPTNNPFDRPMKASWNNWPLSKMEPNYSLQMMSKLCRMMSQYKSTQSSGINNEALVRSLNTMWSRSNHWSSTAVDDTPDKITSSTKMETFLQGRPTEPSSTVSYPAHSPVKPCDRKSFNVSSLL